MDVFAKLKEARESLAKSKKNKKARRKEIRHHQRAEQKKLTILERIRNLKLSSGIVLGMALAPSVVKADTPLKDKDNSERKEITVDQDLIAGVMRFKQELPKLDIKKFGLQVTRDYPEVVAEVIRQRAEVRADELINAYVAEMNAQVDTLQMSRRGTLPHNKQRTKVVNKASGASHRNATAIPYCQATVQSSFVKLASQYLEFTDLTYKTGEHNGLSCVSFVNYMKKAFPQSVVYTKDITKTMMEKDADGNYKYGAGTLAWQTQKNGKSMSHMISFDGRAEDGTPLYDAGNRDINDGKHPLGVAGYVIDTREVLKELAVLYMQDRKENIVLDCLEKDGDGFFEIVDGLKQKNPQKFASLAQKMFFLSSNGDVSENNVDAASSENIPVLTAAYMAKNKGKSNT